MKKVLLILVSALTPLVASAQFINLGGAPNFGYVSSGVDQLFRIATTYVIPTLTLLASAFFIWGVIGYIRADTKENKEKSRHALVQGIIALAVIVSAWGIVRLLQNVAGVTPSTTTNTICPPGYTPVGAICRP
ncbi:MAG: hypothetical protein KBB86_00140 [Candidatus Pacebacteria bacterium]|nr:hypothetical protein [Candidatus Paceibacterota bacterium]